MNGLSPLAPSVSILCKSTYSQLLRSKPPNPRRGTKLDLSDCNSVIDGGQDFYAASIGTDGI